MHFSLRMNLGENRVHLNGSEGPHYRRMDVAHRPQMKEESSGHFVVCGLKDQHAVVVAKVQ